MADFGFRLELRGREIWVVDGRESYVLARIPDELTPEEWQERYGRPEAEAAGIDLRADRG